jgi:hypothetical protein
MQAPMVSCGVTMQAVRPSYSAPRWQLIRDLVLRRPWPRGGLLYHLQQGQAFPVPGFLQPRRSGLDAPL